MPRERDNKSSQVNPLENRNPAPGRAIEPDDFLWVVGAGSAYTLLMVVFQTIWIRSHWLSMWS